MALPIADRWFEKLRVDDDITLIYEPHVVPVLRCNIWHVRGRDRDLMIDTGMGIQSLRTFAKDFLDKPVTAVATHAHVDHIGNHHEFDECLVHGLECRGLTQPSRWHNLADDEFDPSDIASLRFPPVPGYEITGPMITALPHAGYDMASYRIRPAGNVRTVVEGDIIDLGNRILEVLHLPGHSPGGIGLWEERTGTLFSGDAVYDGPLVDNFAHSDVTQYIATFERLRRLPVTAVHGGHEPSFGRDRLVEITEHYLDIWNAKIQG